MSKHKSADPENIIYESPALDRALTIIELLSEHPEGLNLAQIVEHLEIPRHSGFRIVMTLMKRGYLFRNEDTKQFYLSRKFLSIGNRTLSHGNLKYIGMDILRDLRDLTKETVLIGTLVDTEGVFIEQVPGLHAFRFVAELGERFVVHTSALTKAILAYLPEIERIKILSKLTLTRYTAYTITSKTVFCRELNNIRERGYAVDRGEEFEGIHCLGAPILDHHGYPIAAISVTGPSIRLKEVDFETIGKQVADHAQRISQRLGYLDVQKPQSIA